MAEAGEGERPKARDVVKLPRQPSPQPNGTQPFVQKYKGRSAPLEYLGLEPPARDVEKNGQR
jgi:hypothetical protein